MSCGNCETCSCTEEPALETNTVEPSHYCDADCCNDVDVDSFDYHFGPELFKVILDNLKDTAPEELVDQIRYYAESSLPDHAITELNYAGLNLEDTGLDGLFARDLLSIIWLFSTQGHSGGSASAAIPTIERLLNHNIFNAFN